MLLCWLGCIWSLPGQEFQHQRWWKCSGTYEGSNLQIMINRLDLHSYCWYFQKNCCLLMVVHLKLEDHSEEYVDVVGMCVHDYVENPFLLDLSETIIHYTSLLNHLWETINFCSQLQLHETKIPKHSSVVVGVCLSDVDLEVLGRRWPENLDVSIFWVSSFSSNLQMYPSPSTTKSTLLALAVIHFCFML